MGDAADCRLTPREYFQRQCWISFDPGERTGASLLSPIVGADRFVWASDFPHSDAKYPGVVDELRESTTEGMDARRARPRCSARTR